MDEPKKRLTDLQIRLVEERYETILHAEPSLRNFDVEVRITRKNEKSAFPDKEEMLIGWKEIASFLGLHEVVAIRLYKDKFKKEGVVFHKKIRNPKGQVRRNICSYPTLLLAWSVRESQRRSDSVREGVLRLLRKTV